MVNRQLGIRRSYLHESRGIALEFIRQKQQTLVFANSRLATEVLVTYLKDACSYVPFSRDAIRGYRGGYLPKERRQIEEGLTKRKDPGSGGYECARAWHGYWFTRLRGARRLSGQRRIHLAESRPRRSAGNASIAVFVASSAPFDQYMVEHPEYFFGRSPEEAHINADNLEILLSHLNVRCLSCPFGMASNLGIWIRVSFVNFFPKTCSYCITQAIAGIG